MTNKNPQRALFISPLSFFYRFDDDFLKKLLGQIAGLEQEIPKRREDIRKLDREAEVHILNPLFKAPEIRKLKR